MRAKRILFRTLRVSLIIYFGMFAFVFAHLPRTIVVAFPSLGVALAPAWAVNILFVYGKFLTNWEWPYSGSPDALPLDELLNRYGSEGDFGKEVSFVTSSPDIEPGQEGSSYLTLSQEWYSSSFVGAFLSTEGGSVLPFGDYICRFTFDWSSCILVEPHGIGEFRFTELGADNGHVVRIYPIDGAQH